MGTPHQLLDANGAVVWQAAYLPFGEAQITTNTITNNLRFPGQYFDTETGLHYNWNRYYDPASGRYVSADPIGLEGGLNLYVYVHNNAINISDFYGLFTVLNGYGFSTIGVTGIEGSIGIATNPGFFGQNRDVGTFASIGAGVGINVSYDKFIGIMKGDISNVKGETNNLNISVNVISLSIFFDPKSGKIIGATVGRGGGLKFGISITKSKTLLITLRDIIDRKNSDRICDDN